MKRKIEEQLLQWKNKKKHKPLIIYGARQTGKTYSIKEFGAKYYKDTIYLNFETNLKIVKDFDEDISPKFLIGRMELFFGKKIKPESTLIIFDEIQACERGLTSLKYFCEDAPEYQVIAAGSLLGVAVHRERYSFPVGKVDMLNMYPMDFEEFLWALGKEMLSEEISKHYFSKEKMDPVIHDILTDLYRNYLVIGGMPGVMNAYLEEEKLMDASSVQADILNAYVADMAKYATPSDTTKIMACFDSIPAQLAKDNKKFQYKVITQGGKASLFGASIDWLLAAGVTTKCERVEQGMVPLEIHKNLSAFKLYMNDIGLLIQKAGVSTYDIISGNENYFIGAITENFVANTLERSGYKLYYWTSGGEAEIDFIIQKDNKAVPIEVKARNHVKSRSLMVYYEKFKPEYCVRLSSKNFGYENNILSIPLYAAHMI